MYCIMYCYQTNQNFKLKYANICNNGEINFYGDMLMALKIQIPQFIFLNEKVKKIIKNV